MEDGRATTSRHKTDGRGVHHGLAAVIALTLALAAALQAGFSRLATQSAIAAVISASEAGAGSDRGTTRATNHVATLANRGPARVISGFEQTPAAGYGQVGVVFDATGHCRAGLGAIPPPVC